MPSFGFSPAPGEGEQVEAVVKWFNLSKGFGFVALLNGMPDAFMHMSVLARAGLQPDQVQEGTKLLVEAGQGAKGPQVLQILQVLGMAEVPPGPGSNRPAPTGPVETLTGTVKWFKNDKGFGFVTPDDGGRDVFVHKSAVTRIGMSTLEPGQRLNMTVQTASKGREAVTIEAI